MNFDDISKALSELSQGPQDRANRPAGQVRSRILPVCWVR